MPEIVNLTESAKKYLKSVGDPNVLLSVNGGGCSGFQYGFTFDEEVQDDDTVIENKGARLIVDPLSFQYLVGAKIDYKEGLEGSRFVVENPMASSTCGCGASFSI